MTRILVLLLAVVLASCSSGLSPSQSGSEGSSSILPPPQGVNDTNKTYPVYSGCEAPSENFARTIYVDPVNGTDAGDGSMASPLKTLANAFSTRKVLVGDHVVALPGDHGAVAVTKYNNAALENASQWLWLDFRAGARLQKLEVRDMSRWLITKPEVTNNSTQLIAISGGSNIVIADGSLYTTKDASAWTVNEWVNIASSGIATRNTKCAAILRNKLVNVRFGIGIQTDSPSLPANSTKTLVLDNEVRNYSGDGMRPNASDVLLVRNKIIDSYVSPADGDPNHDDGIQMFALNGAVYDNIVIDGNLVQDRTSQSRSLKGEMQGIAVFDGLLTRLSIRNNVVIGSAYHGISVYGGKDCVVENNTVATSHQAGRDFWIGVFNNKDGTPPNNVIVRNNISDRYSLVAGTIQQNNHTVKTVDAPNVYEIYDLANAVFDLVPRVGSAVYGLGVGAP